MKSAAQVAELAPHSLHVGNAKSPVPARNSNQISGSSSQQHTPSTSTSEIGSNACLTVNRCTYQQSSHPLLYEDEPPASLSYALSWQLIRFPLETKHSILSLPTHCTFCVAVQLRSPNRA
jgi:hypothetical protein